jgi:hypothetical protein
MTTTEAITALRTASTARRTTDKVARRAANKAFKAAASVVWAMFLANPTNDQLHEIVSVYSIEG